eukprot:TRINITY_DN15294_c0_g1_i1.p1 TRINITY_DN15294_c0_g1~~TRINITY_DN15294_c0_g1_i1.p1  ORF type:complete len:128 (-),score=11.74 TRINITY_DN15294_c0_g1_i1:55-438(-)
MGSLRLRQTIVEAQLQQWLEVSPASVQVYDWLSFEAFCVVDSSLLLSQSSMRSKLHSSCLMSGKGGPCYCQMIFEAQSLGVEGHPLAFDTSNRVQCNQVETCVSVSVTFTASSAFLSDASMDSRCLH